MPIYHVSAPTWGFATGAKQQLAKAITQVHCGVTGAEPKLVNVYVQEYGNDDVYVAGEPSRQSLRHGMICAGRGDAAHKAILQRISRHVAEIANIDETEVGVAIEGIDASHASEGGKVLPQSR